MPRPTPYLRPPVLTDDACGRLLDGPHGIGVEHRRRRVRVHPPFELAASFGFVGSDALGFGLEGGVEHCEGRVGGVPEVEREGDVGGDDVC